MNKYFKLLRYTIEASPIYAIAQISQWLPIDHASSIGGWIGRYIGSKLPISHRAHAHLRFALPHYTAENRHAIITSMWNNLGRIVMEIPHIHTLMITEKSKEIAEPHIIVENSHILSALASQQQQVIFISAHMGNWEILSCVADHYGLPFVGTYRAANNPFVERLIQKLRKNTPGGLVKKGSTGARALLKHLIRGNNIGFLVDQKLNDGEDIPFFGHPARTALSPAELSVKYDLPLIGAHCIREGTTFRIIISPPIHPNQKASNKKAEAIRLMTAVNLMIEEWIRAHPDQWFWLHRRWGKSID